MPARIAIRVTALVEQRDTLAATLQGELEHRARTDATVAAALSRLEQLASMLAAPLVDEAAERRFDMPDETAAALVRFLDLVADDLRGAR